MKQHITKFLTILLIFISSHSYSQVVIDQIIAVVGDEMIKQSDIENQIIQMKQFGAKETDINPCKLFEDLLFQKLLVDQARIDSVIVSDNEVDNEINRRIAMFTNESGGLAQLESFYGKTELEIKTEWKPLIKEQLMAQKIQGTIIGTVEVSPNEIRKYFSTIIPDSIPMVPQQYEFSEIVIKPKITALEETEIKKKLEDVRQRAIKGENFSKLAILYSDDTESAKNGGLLGDYVSRGELVPEFAAAAFRLKEGEISRIVKTNYGYHIIQMVEIKGEKAKLKHILLRPKVSNQTIQATSARADSIYKLLRDTLSFETAAAKYSDDEKTKYNGGKYINPYTNSSKFEVSAIDPNVLYSIKKLKPGEITEPMLGYDETGMQAFKIIKLISITESHRATLIDDYQTIKEMALQDKKQNLVTAWIKQKQDKTYINFPDSKFKQCDFKYNNWIKK